MKGKYKLMHIGCQMCKQDFGRSIWFGILQIDPACGLLSPVRKPFNSFLSSEVGDLKAWAHTATYVSSKTFSATCHSDEGFHLGWS